MGEERDPLVGQVLDGRYRVERLVGGGGMGRVYEAVQVDLGRRVALKVLIPELARQPMILERFRREAQAAGVLASPHIVDVTEFVQPSGEAPFLVMEHLVGTTLTRVLERDGALAIGRARRICVQLLDGLQEAHDAGIIHRDLKPDNVFLQSLADGQEMVKLLDFGVAKLTEASTEGPALTAVGALVGTPRFASPEQLRGGPVDARTDVYGAGVLLYGMLTGRPPFGGSTQEVIQAVLSKEAPDVRVINPSIEPHLAHVVQKAMAKEPDGRFASAEEMLRELGGRRAKAGSATTKVAEVRRAVERKESREKERGWLRGAIVAVGVLAVLIAAATVGWLSYYLAARADEDDAPAAPVATASAAAPSGACDRFLAAACACPDAPDACDAASARVTGLRGDAADVQRLAAVEGWCRISLEAGDACRAEAATREPPPPSAIGPGVPRIAGALDAGSWRRADGSFAERYSLSLREGDAMEISMQGAELESHLLLLEPNGRIVGAAATSLGSRAKISVEPTETGIFILEVGAGPGQAGRYTLTFERRAARRVVDGSRAPGQRSRGSGGRGGGPQIIRPWGQ